MIYKNNNKMRKLVSVLLVCAFLFSLCTLAISCVVLLQDADILSRLSRIMLYVMIGLSATGTVTFMCIGGFVDNNYDEKYYDYD